MRDPSSKISRRQFIQAGLLLAGTTPIVGVSSWSHPALEAASVIIPVHQLPPALAGYRIGFLTDVHLSAFLQENLLEEAIARLKSFDLDLLLLGGDYIWKPRDLLREVFPVYRSEFSDLNHPNLEFNIYTRLIELISDIKPRNGTYAILGNHDRWGASAISQRIFASSSIKLLVNQTARISHAGETLEIFGGDDYLTGRPRLPEHALTSPVRILLTHNPDILPWYLDRHKLPFSLAVMGHTHGGQICPMRGVALSYNIRNARYGEGLVMHPSGCACYTARGIGCVGLPLRFNCPPEVTLLTLQPA